MFDFSKISDIKPRSKSPIRCRSTAKQRSHNQSLHKLKTFINNQPQPSLISPKQIKTKFSDLRKNLTQNAQHLQNNHIKQIKTIQGVPFVQIKQPISISTQSNHRNFQFNFSSRIKMRQNSESREKAQGKFTLFGDIVRAQRENSSLSRKKDHVPLIVRKTDKENKQNKTQNTLIECKSRSKSKDCYSKFKNELASKKHDNPVKIQDNYIIECKNKIFCVKQQHQKVQSPGTFKQLMRLHNIRSFKTLNSFQNMRY